MGLPEQFSRQHNIQQIKLFTVSQQLLSMTLRISQEGQFIQTHLWLKEIKVVPVVSSTSISPQIKSHK